MNSLMAPSSTRSGREWVRDCPENFRHNPSMKDFRNLKVWEKAHQLALALYPITNSFPREETYGLASQIRRAASSIPSRPRIGWLLHYRQGLRQRTGIPTPAGSRSETDPTQGLRNTVRADCRDQTHAHGLGSEADRWRLNADCARQPNPRLWLRPRAALVMSS